MSSFSFKKFTIEQDQCAMKVSLDACLLGALCELKPGLTNQQNKILDIGTGTGLLTLMLAQRMSVKTEFDAVELEENASNQAKTNFANSPFPNKITVHHGSIQQFHSEYPYDLIICNPPFFTNQLNADNEARNLARHNQGLSFADLTQAMAKHLAEQGIVWVLLPLSERKGFEAAAAQNGLFLERDWHIQSSPNKPVKTTIFTLTKSPQIKPVLPSKIRVYDENNQYTDHFSRLLADYYLKL